MFDLVCFDRIILQDNYFFDDSLMNKVPNQLLARSTLVYPKDAVNAAITRLAGEIALDLQDKMPLVLTVMNGGLYFAGQLLPQLNFALETDYLQASRYHGETVGQDVKWGRAPTDQLKGRTVLLLDDILDEGHTLVAIRDQCVALGALEVKIAVLTAKDLGYVKPIEADYVGLTLPNRYVFGCGMDVYGWWRNLPEIRALEECDLKDS
jgi:hypoxanthine phosphoribosyltransferase